MACGPYGTRRPAAVSLRVGGQLPEEEWGGGGLRAIAHDAGRGRRRRSVGVWPGWLAIWVAIAPGGA